MTIKVIIDSFSYDEQKQIIDYYNNHKQPDEEPLEQLDRAEGGFKIKITHLKNIHCDENKKIKQLRWDKKRLVEKTYMGFNENEEKLLYESMVQILGSENVILEQSRCFYINISTYYCCYVRYPFVYKFFNCINNERIDTQ